MVDMTNIERLRQSQAEHIILHKNLKAEMFAHLIPNRDKARPPVYPPVIRLDSIYRKWFGPPVFEDRNIIVFRIPNEK